MRTHNALYDDDNLQFYDSIVQMVEGDFKKAATFLFPLLKDVVLNSIQIGVHITGVMMLGRDSASYFYEHADESAGTIFFSYTVAC